MSDEIPPEDQGRIPELEEEQLSDEQLAERLAVELAEANPYGKPESCLACPLVKEPGIVWGTGDPESKIAFFAEAPGEEEVLAKPMKPLIGGSGRLFTALTAQAGINRNYEAFISNIVKCRPPGNRLPTEEEVKCCAPFLKEELDASKANVIIPLGDLSLKTLGGVFPIGLYRGVAREGRGPAAGRKLFPTWHPAFIARSQHNWPFCVHDLVRAKAESAFPEIRKSGFEIIRDARPTIDGPTLLRDARTFGGFTFDFETSGLIPATSQIVMVGACARRDQANVFTWSAASQQLLQAAFDDPEIEICGQNILHFDLPFAEAKGVDLSKLWKKMKIFDTMVGFHLTNASYGQTPVHEQKAGSFRQRGMEKDLTMIASCHTDIPYWKSEDNYRSDLRKVCGTDCIATHRAAYDDIGIKAELKMYDMLDLYYKHVLPVHPILRKMTARGVRIDEDRAARWSKVLESEADLLEDKLRLDLGEPYLNFNSAPQMQDLLYNKLGLPIQYVMDKKKGLRPTANAEALETLSTNFPQHKELRNLTDIRYLRKMKSTFVDPALMAGWVHPNFSGSKTSTGRVNSWGPNAQNVPEEMRDIWVPDDDDCVILAADWSQIEWRVGIVLAADEVGLDLLSRGVDNHRAVAAEALGKRIEDVTDAERHSAKFIVYGLGYGRGAESIAEGHNLEIGFVKQFISNFMRRFRGFARWRDENVRFVQANHHLANPFKRRRWWYTYQITEVYNFPQQSTGADMMYDALILLEEQLPPQATLRLTVHDEVVINCPKDIVKEVWAIVKRVMEKPWPQIVAASRNPEVVQKYYPDGWFCPVDVHLGTNWKQAKSKDSEDKKARTELEKYFGVH